MQQQPASAAPQQPSGDKVPSLTLCHRISLAAAPLVDVLGVVHGVPVAVP